MSSGFVIFALLGVLGAALIAAGIVAYRGSTRIWIRACAAAAVAVGVALWAILLFITPVTVTTGG